MPSLVVVLGGADPAHACSCATTDDATAFAEAGVVFVGTLRETIEPPDGAVISSTDPRWFVFDVERVYQGAALAQQLVVTVRDGASCGISLSGPDRFLVFGQTQGAGASEAVPRTGLCSGTRSLVAGAPPELLGAGVAPVAGASARPVVSTAIAAPSLPVGVAVVATLAALGTVAVGLVVQRRRTARRSQP